MTWYLLKKKILISRNQNNQKSANILTGGKRKKAENPEWVSWKLTFVNIATVTEMDE